MNKIFYVVKEIGVSKGFNTVYNKQEQIGVYEQLDEYDYKLLTVVDTENQEVPLKKRVNFLSSLRYNAKMGKGKLDEIQIIGSCPGQYDSLYFENFEDAVIAKLIMLKKIQEYFDEELEKIKAKMKKNLPQDLDLRMKFLEDLLK